MSWGLGRKALAAAALCVGMLGAAALPAAAAAGTPTGEAPPPTTQDYRCQATGVYRTNGASASLVQSAPNACWVQVVIYCRTPSGDQRYTGPWRQKGTPSTAYCPSGTGGLSRYAWITSYG